MSTNSFTTESKKVCVKYQTGKVKSGKKKPCVQYTFVKFTTTYSTSSDGTATSEIKIISDDGANKGDTIGYLNENGGVKIPWSENAKLHLNDAQSDNRRNLVISIQNLRNQNNLIKIEDIINNNELSNAQKVAILNNLGEKNKAKEITELQTETEKAAANKEGKIVEANIEEGLETLKNIQVGGRTARGVYGSGYPNNNYYYPADLASNKQDRVKFTMGYSEGTKIDATVESGIKNFQKRISSITGSVTLPIVTGVSDQSSVDWKGAELNPLQAFAAAGALDLFKEAQSNKSLSKIGSNAMKTAMEGVQGMADSGLGDAINVWLAQKAVGAQNLLSRTTGAIVNPNLEMLFNAPQLRNFGFTFLLSPRDADEADQVRKIIRFFKQGMSVKTTASNVFLKAPNIFQIKYMTFNTDGTEILHPSINIIKTCALLSMDVQYTPAGTYMTYEDPYRTMTAYQLTMQFGELDPIYDSDYTELDNDNDTVIGY